MKRPSWMPRWLTWPRVEAAITLALLAFVAVRLAPQAGALVGVGGPGTALPAFRAVTLAGDTLDSGDFEGRVVVVNFWATWCAPCRWEMPALQKLHEERKERGLILLGISRDGGGAEGAVRAFLDERGVTYPVTIDDGRLARAFGGLRGLPTTLIVDRRGVVRHRVYGYFAPAALRVAVDRLLDEPLR